MTYSSPAGMLDRVSRFSLSRRALLRKGTLLGAGAAAALLTSCGSSSTPSVPPASVPTKKSDPATEQQVSMSVATPVPTYAPSASPTAPNSAIATSVPAQHLGGTLIQGLPVDVTTLNPIFVNDAASTDVVRLMFNGVMRADPATAEPRGDLARSWEISGDGLTYTFVLNQGVTWHDKSPVTSDDVKFTYGLIMNTDTKSPHTADLAGNLTSVDAPDPQTVTFRLASAASPFLVTNMTYGVLPKHILAKVDPKSLAQHPFSTGKQGTTIGTGPFTFTEWVKQDHISLTSYPSYFRGAPNLHYILFKVLGSADKLPQQLVAQQIDYTGRGGVGEASVKVLQQAPGVTIVDYDSFNFTYFSYQLDPAKSKLFQDKAVRQALLYALDRQQMISAVRFGLGQVAVGTMSPASWAYSPDNITLKYPYDTNKANALLDAAGWVKGSDGIRAKDGVKLSFKLYSNSGNDVNAEYMSIMQNSWKFIGVDCTPVQEDWNTLLKRLTSDMNFDMFLIAFSWGLDPDQSGMWSSGAYGKGFNLNKYSNPRVDELLKQGLIETSVSARKQIYTQMQNIIVDDLPSAFIDFPRSIAAYGSRVHNLFPNAIDDRWNAHEWWVDA